jgi:4-amino-4-deoxy-L-arabinose transferase-like glycosyltransferase
MVAAGIFFIVMGIIQLFKYRLWINPLLGLFLGTGCFLAIYCYSSPGDLIRIVYFLNFLVIILLIILSWPVLYSQERFEANARRIFKLAAEMVVDEADGYTNRPFAGGNANASSEELKGFARFINGKYIARSLYEGDVLYFAFSMNRSILKISEPGQVSYISFDKEGKIHVQIAEPDYRQYLARINFGQLCASLAGVFVRFLNYYREGKEERILTELKTARM